MLKLNCLIKNTEAVQLIRDAIEILVGNRIENGQTALFPQIFNDLRKANLEIDAESAGSIYDALYGELEDDALSPTQDVEDYAGYGFENQLKAIVNDILGTATAPDEQQLGLLSPEKHAVNKISKMFQNATFGTTKATSSALKQMQDLVTKAAVSLLPPTKNLGVGLTASLSNFFEVESNQFKTLDGQVNTLKTLHDAVKREVANYVDQLAYKLDEYDADILRAQWDKYTEAFINSAYDIVLNKGNQNSLVNNALKQIKVEGLNIIDINGNVKWSALIENNDPDTISEKVAQLFKDGFTENGTVIKYNSSQADRIGDYFKRIYIEKLDAAKKRAQENNRVKNKSAKNIISDFLKDRGYFNLVKDKDGKLLLSQADWAGALEFIKKQVAKSDVGRDGMNNVIMGLDLVKNRLRVFLNSQKNADGTSKFNESQKQLIIDEFVRTVIAKLAPGSIEPNSLDRLIALDKINQGNAFREETQQAVNKVVGVSGLDQSVLNKLHSLSQIAHSIMAGGIVTGSTNPNPGVNRGAYAYTALVEIDRKIKEILREHKVDSARQQRIVKYLSDVMGAGPISLLLNPNNIVENVATQFATNIGETVNMMFTNPQFITSLGKFQGDFWTSWMNYVRGGASNEITNESDLSSDLQSSERLRVRGALNEVKEHGIKGLMSVISKSPQYVVSIFSRTIMNSFDAATTTSLMRKKLVQTTYKSLLDQGKSAKEAFSIMDKAFNIPDSIKAEIEVENVRIAGLLKAAGLPVNSTMMAQNASDMRMSVYEDIIRDQALNAGKSVKQATEITKSLIEASQAQAKMLGGKKILPTNDWLSSWIYGAAKAILAPQKTSFNAARSAEAEGRLNKAARRQLAGSTYQNTLGKFVGGVANFMVLGISATPYGLVWMAPKLQAQRNEYLKKTGAQDIFSATPEQIKKYAELHGMMRSIYTRSIMGSIAAAGFIARVLIKGADGDDDDDDFLANLMKTKTGRRFIQKHFPLMVSLVASYSYEGGAKDDAVDRVFNMLEAYAGTDFNSFSSLKKSLKYAKSPEEKKAAWGKFWGSIAPTYNVNQLEQIIKFQDVFNSGLTGDLSTVEQNEAKSKEIYKSLEGFADAFWLNGIIDAMTREDFNRFKKDY